MKKWKEAASAALLATFVMTGALPALAAEGGTGTQQADQKTTKAPAGQMQEAEAIARAKALFGELKELSFVNASYSEQFRNNDQPNWSVTFMDHDPTKWEENQDPPNLLQVTIDAKTGDVLIYNRQDRAWAGSDYPSKDLAISTATAFLQKIAPSLLPKLTAPQVSGQSNGSSVGANGKEIKFSSSAVVFHERVNGIPFQSNSLSVQVDQFGHVTSFWNDFRLDSSKLPKPEQAISKAEATVAFQKHFSLSPEYRTHTFYQSKNGTEYKETPVLTLATGDLTPIDAITGQVWNPGIRYPFENQKNERLTVEGQGQILQAKDKQDAARVIGELFQIDLSKLQFTDRGDVRNIPGRETWELEWHEEYNEQTMANKRQPMSYYGTFDAKTGALLYAGQNGGDSKDGGQLAFTLEEGRAKALDIFKAHMPKGSRDLMTGYIIDETDAYPAPSWSADHPNKSPHRYDYTFRDTHQGLPVSDVSYSVTLNPYTGQLESISLPSFADVALPDNKGTVDLNVAEATFLRDHPLTLQYVWVDYRGQAAPQGNLIWGIDYTALNSSYIDAFTGREVKLDETN